MKRIVILVLLRLLVLTCYPGIYDVNVAHLFFFVQNCRTANFDHLKRQLHSVLVMEIFLCHPIFASLDRAS